MKTGDPTFDMKSLIRMDVCVDLSMIQTAIAYLFKTSALHDKEIVEFRQAHLQHSEAHSKLKNDF